MQLAAMLCCLVLYWKGMGVNYPEWITSGSTVFCLGMEVFTYIPRAARAGITDVVEFNKSFHSIVCVLSALVLNAQKEKVVNGWISGGFGISHLKIDVVRKIE